MSDAKALLILHGKQALNEDVREAVKQQRELGWELAVRVSWEPGDAQRLVQEALSAGYRMLVVGGGDGTLREVAETMLESGAYATLALLRLGRANDIAKYARITTDPFNLMAVLDAPSPAAHI